MVDKIDPTNLSSVEYGSQLLQQKQRRDEEYQKRVAKDVKIENWLAGISTIDQIMKNRATRNLDERNNEIEKLIIKEKADYNRLQKEYDSQKGFRDAIENGDGAMYHARTLAAADLAKLPKYSNADFSTIDANDEFSKDYLADLDRIAQVKLDAYNKNRVSMPAPTLEEYISPLRDMQKKEVPAGVFNFIAEKVGWRDPIELADIDKTKTTYSPDLLESRRGTGKAGVSTQVAADLDLFNPAKGQFRKEKTRIEFRDGKAYKIITDVDGNESFTMFTEKEMGDMLKPSVSIRLKPKDRSEYVADWSNWKQTNFVDEVLTENQLLNKLRQSEKQSDKRLYSAITREGIVPLPQSSFNVQETKNAILSKITRLPEKQAEKIENLNEGEMSYFLDEVIRNADYAIRYGIVEKGTLNTNLEPVAIEYALKTQLRGISLANKEGLFSGFTKDEYVFDSQPYEKEEYENTGIPTNAEEARRMITMKKWRGLTDEFRQEFARSFEAEYGEELGGDFPLTFDESVDDRNVYSKYQIEAGIPDKRREQQARDEAQEKEQSVLDNVTNMIVDIRRSSVSKPRFKYTLTASEYDAYEQKLKESQNKQEQFEELFGFSMDTFVKEATRGMGITLEKRLEKDPTLLDRISEFLS
tara:strand:+ start:625 stop:2547 length:1923 start_codon:yes stop_codon:yes gene_type:complete